MLRLDGMKEDEKGDSHDKAMKKLEPGDLDQEQKPKQFLTQELHWFSSWISEDQNVCNVPS